MEGNTNFRELRCHNNFSIFLCCPILGIGPPSWQLWAHSGPTCVIAAVRISHCGEKDVKSIRLQRMGEGQWLCTKKSMPRSDFVAPCLKASPIIAFKALPTSNQNLIFCMDFFRRIGGSYKLQDQYFGLPR